MLPSFTYIIFFRNVYQSQFRKVLFHYYDVSGCRVSVHAQRTVSEFRQLYQTSVRIDFVSKLGGLDATRLGTEFRSLEKQRNKKTERKKETGKLGGTPAFLFPPGSPISLHVYPESQILNLAIFPRLLRPRDARFLSLFCLRFCLFRFASHSAMLEINLSANVAKMREILVHSIAVESIGRNSAAPKISVQDETRFFEETRGSLRDREEIAALTRWPIPSFTRIIHRIIRTQDATIISSFLEHHYSILRKNHFKISLD